MLLSSILFKGFFIYVHGFIYCWDVSDDKVKNNIAMIYVCVILSRERNPFC